MLIKLIWQGVKAIGNILHRLIKWMLKGIILPCSMLLLVSCFSSESPTASPRYPASSGTLTKSSGQKTHPKIQDQFHYSSEPLIGISPTFELSLCLKLASVIFSSILLFLFLVQLSQGTLRENVRKMLDKLRKT